MNTSMTIEAFHALMAEERQESENTVLAALRKLTSIEAPEVIAELGRIMRASWGGWGN
jgi:metal-sulfur cluster biosynthetic enzyme